MVKVLLIVVQGKPEGKSIPVTVPVFRIGRGTDCHLRPNSEEVSRTHTEITLTDTEAIVRDLGSRNGTWVNGQLLKGPHKLSSGELLKVGPLTFAVAIQGVTAASGEVVAPTATASPVGAAAHSSGGLDDVPPDQIDAWLVSDPSKPTPDRPSGVYDGETVTFQAYRDAKKTGSSGAVPAAQPVPTPMSTIEAQLGNIEMLPEGAGDSPQGYVDEDDNEERDEDDEGDEQEDDANEMIDENNPFYIAKKAAAAEEAAQEAAKPSYKDSSDAANDILKKMLDRRRSPR